MPERFTGDELGRPGRQRHIVCASGASGPPARLPPSDDPMILRVCAVCPRLIPKGAGSRCAEHAVPRRGHAHRQARAQTLAEEQQ